MILNLVGQLSLKAILALLFVMSRHCYAQRLDITYFRKMWVSGENQLHAI